jgi:hypothetical protein
LKIEESSLFDNPEIELFFYCVMMGRFEMAEVFWQVGKDQISSALLAVKMIKSMSDHFDEYKETLEEKAL